MADNPFQPTIDDLTSLMTSQPSYDMVTKGYAMGADVQPKYGLTGQPQGQVPTWMLPLMIMAGMRPTRPMRQTRPQGATNADVGAQVGAEWNQPWAPSSSQMMGGRQIMNGPNGMPMVVTPENFVRPPDVARQGFQTGWRWSDWGPPMNPPANQGHDKPLWTERGTGGPPDNNIDFMGRVVPFRSRQQQENENAGYQPRGGNPDNSHVGQLNSLDDTQFQVYLRARDRGMSPQDAIKLAKGE